MDPRKGHRPPDRIPPQEGGRGQVRLHRREQRRKNRNGNFSGNFYYLFTIYKNYYDTS